MRRCSDPPVHQRCVPNPVRQRNSAKPIHQNQSGQRSVPSMSIISRSGNGRSPQMHTIPKSPSARQRLLKSHIALKSPETPYLMSCSIKARITRAAQPESSAPIESTELIENHLSPNEQNRSPSNKTDMRSSRKSEMIAT